MMMTMVMVMVMTMQQQEGAGAAAGFSVHKLVLRTNGAYCAMCSFWVQSWIRTSVWGFTSIN